jgi:hypothetical protein
VEPLPLGELGKLARGEFERLRRLEEGPGAAVSACDLAR